jgi:hypothetical protein
MADRQHDVAELLPCLDVSRRLDDRLEGVGAVDDRPIPARRHELAEHLDVSLRVRIAVKGQPDSLRPDEGREKREEGVLPQETKVRDDVGTPRTSDRLQRRNECLPTASKTTS